MSMYIYLIIFYFIIYDFHIRYKFFGNKMLEFNQTYNNIVESDFVYFDY